MKNATGWTERRDMLLVAIVTAKNPGACRYAVNGEPCCVVGQLAHKMGVPVEELDTWDRDVDGGAIEQVVNMKESASEVFLGPFVQEFTSRLIDSLQYIWDQSVKENEDVSRVEMVNAVHKFYRNHEGEA